MNSSSPESSVDSEYSGVTLKHLKIVEEKRRKWFALKQRITQLVNNVSMSNVVDIAGEVAREDLFKGRGVFCHEIMKSQMDSPELTNVYAAFVAIINPNFPDVGLLLVKRILLKLREEYNPDRSPKKLLDLSMFLAHLVNQLVVHVRLANEVFLFLMGNQTPDHVEVAVRFCIECGSTFQEFLPGKFSTVVHEFDRVSQEMNSEWSSVHFWIDMLFKLQRQRFRDHPGIEDGLDFVKIWDQVIHQVSMLHVLDYESSADEFEVDPHDFCGMDDSSDDDDDNNDDTLSDQKS